jgi:signal peptidase I
MSLTVPAPAATGPAAPPGDSPRRPWLAGIVSLFVPGLGHVYAGRARTGLLLGVGAIVCGVGLVALGMRSESPVLRVLSLVAIVAAFLSVAVHAHHTAVRAEVPYRARWYNRWFFYVAIWLVATAVTQGVRAYTMGAVARAFAIPGASMQPALLPGDRILASPRVAAPVQRGAPVIYYQAENDLLVVSRAVGLPGDTLEMRSNALFLNGLPVEEPYARYLPGWSHEPMEELLWQEAFLLSGAPEAEGYRPTLATWGPLVVPPDHYFAMGDNRDMSMDSRVTGFVPREALFGHPRWIYFSSDALTGIRWKRIGRGVE